MKAIDVLRGMFRAKPSNPARDLALIGAAKREAMRKAKTRAFHREMRAALGLPAVAEFEERTQS